MRPSPVRRLVRTMLLAGAALALLAAPAVAGTIEADSATNNLRYTGANGVDNITITQPSAKVLHFDEAAPLTLDPALAAVCVLEGDGDVTCTADPAWEWLTIFASLMDGDDRLDASGVTTVKINASSSPNEGNDTLIGGAANDMLLGHGGNDTIIGGAGNDSIEGGAGDDQLWGGDGHDSLDGGAGNDAIRGDAGHDTMLGGDGADHVDGGEGHDIAGYLGAAAGVTVDLAAGTGGWTGHIDALVSIEEVSGSELNDVLRGNDDDNILNGLGGDDTLEGRGGFDEYDGNRGNDTILAVDNGIDLIRCGSDDADVATIDHLDQLAANSGCETVHKSAPPVGWPMRGTDGDDTIHGTDGAETILTFAGHDTVYARGGNDVVRGGPGADKLRGGPGKDEVHGGQGNDTVHGNAGNDELFGGQGADTIVGGAGNDELHGGIGRDRLNGSSGNDLLRGGPGADRLLGGVGNDVLVGGTGIDYLNGGPGRDVLVSRDGRRRDTVICTRVNLASRRLRAQRDTVIADRGDIIRNRAWCARVFVF